MSYAIKVYFTILFNMLSPFGRRSSRNRLKRLTMLLILVPSFTILQIFHWLCLGLDCVLFSGIRDVKLRKPLFIVGVPRSGTTFLHRIIAKDSRQFTTMKTWELLFAPSIVQKLFWIAAWKTDSALGGWLAKGLEKVDRIVFKHMDSVHPISLFDAEEDFIALTPVMGCFLLVMLFPDEKIWSLSHFDQSLKKEDCEKIMAFYKGIVRRHLYVYGHEKTYLSKNPSFTPMLRSLQGTFPDGNFVATVRHPNEVAPSLLNSMMDGARTFEIYLGDGDFQNRLLEQLTHYYGYLHEVLAKGGQETKDIFEFRTLTTSPRLLVKEMYDRFGYLYTDDFDRILVEVEEKSKSYESGHHYSLAQFGIRAKELDEMFADTYSRFHYIAEPTVHAA